MENYPPFDITNTTRIMTNIFVFLDTIWPYFDVVDYVNYVLQRLNVNPYASQITLLAASDGTPIVNATNYMSDVFANWNSTSHSWFRWGFNLPIILNTARDLAANLMDAEQTSSSLGGQSLIALLIPSPISYVSEEDAGYCKRFIEYLNYTVPDLRFIYYAGGAPIRFKDYVANPSDDLYILSLDWEVRKIGEPVVQRIRREPRRIANPRCGSSWTINTWGSNAMTQQVDLGGINFYRIMPNYFFGSSSMRYLQINPISSISFTVCTSREFVLPYRNGTNTPAGVTCAQTTTNSFTYDLSDACEGFLLIEACSPLSVSVRAQDFADRSQVSCDSVECQTPIQAQFSIFVNNLSCNSAERPLGVQLTTTLLLALLTTSLRSA